MELAVGVSGVHSAAGAGPKALQEATDAGAAAVRGADAAGLVLFEELSARFRLLQGQSPDVLVDIARRTVVPLLEYDARRHTHLLETLRTLLDNHYAVQPTAEALFIHRNTLQKRLRRIESLLEVDLTDIDDLMELYLGLRALQLVGEARATGEAPRRPPRHGVSAGRVRASSTASAGVDARRTPSSSPPSGRRDLPCVQQDHGLADVARQGDLAERAPGAAQGDHHVAAGDDAQVARVAHRAADGVGEVGGGASAIGLRQDADRDAASPLHAAGHGLHDALAPAADDDEAAVREELSELLGLRGQLRRGAAGADDAHVTGLVHVASVPQDGAGRTARDACHRGPVAVC